MAPSGRPKANAAATEATFAVLFHPASFLLGTSTSVRTRYNTPMSVALAHTPLHTWHAAHGARLVDFAGWSMPVQYTSIVAEHTATRTAAGFFDVSHMARFRFEGSGAGAFLDRLVTRRIADMQPGQVRYALVTNHEGGMLDDVLVYRLCERGSGQTYYQMVVNSSNRRKIETWIEAQWGRDPQFKFVDATHDSAMIAVQGPRALEILDPLSSLNPGSLKYYTATEADLNGAPGILSRTGYTGEDGWELIVPADAAPDLWQQLVDRGAPLGGLPAGLGCRDTLRLEAAMPLYGHELTESIDPLQAGLGFAVDLDNRSFPGSDRLRSMKDNSDRPRRVGWQLESRRVPREGYEVFSGDESIGQVTSGTFSPTLNCPIAMGYCRAEFAALGSNVMIDVRGAREPARVVKLPFYRRSRLISQGTNKEATP